MSEEISMIINIFKLSWMDAFLLLLQFRYEFAKVELKVDHLVLKKTRFKFGP